MPALLLRTACRLLLLGATAAAAAPVVERGELGGAAYAIAHPAKWNHAVLLLAHGFRNAGATLDPELDPARPDCRALLDEGWIVAATSYRRNGVILADAIADLDALRAHIAETSGLPTRVLLEGDAMGGLVVTLMAERLPEPDAAGHPTYDGALAVDATLSDRESNSTVGLSLQPKLPLLFLANQDELDAPAHYLEKAILRDRGDVRPGVARVAREGHVNVSAGERLACLRLLDAWIDGRTGVPPVAAFKEPFLDVTIAPAVRPSQVTRTADGRGFAARVAGGQREDGALVLDAQAADFAAAGIRPLTWFQLAAAGRTWRVRYGNGYQRAGRGEWIAFPDADGFTRLVRALGDAAAASELRQGDAVTVRRYVEEPSPTD